MEVLKLNTGDVIQILGISEDQTECDDNLTLTSTPALFNDTIVISFTYPTEMHGECHLPVECMKRNLTTNFDINH